MDDYAEGVEISFRLDSIITVFCSVSSLYYLPVGNAEEHTHATIDTVNRIGTVLPVVVPYSVRITTHGDEIIIIFSPPLILSPMR